MILLKTISGTAAIVRRRSVRSASVRSVLSLSLAVMFVMWSGVSFADRLVDPNAVAPEYRAVAEKRRAEQIKLFECSKKADAAKIVRRDRAAFVSDCMDK
jgi:hypothetical protein